MNLIEGTPFPDIFEDACHSETCLLQGDIIKIVEDLKLFKKQSGAIGYLIVSNSCDLEHGNVRSISLVPIYPLDVWYKDHSTKTLDNLTKALFEEVNYGKKATFFISPLDRLGSEPLIAFIDDIKSIRSRINAFNWNEVPGRDNTRFIKFLIQMFRIDWVKDTCIEKIESDNVIQASTEKNTLFLIHNSSEATLVIDDGRIYKFKAMINNGNLNIIFSLYDLLLKYRLCSLKPPWREQLGHKVGNLFNRVSTFTPKQDEIKIWTKTYKEEKF